MTTPWNSSQVCFPKTAVAPTLWIRLEKQWAYKMRCKQSGPSLLAAAQTRVGTAFAMNSCWLLCRSTKKHSSRQSKTNWTRKQQQYSTNRLATANCSELKVPLLKISIVSFWNWACGQRCRTRNKQSFGVNMLEASKMQMQHQDKFRGRLGFKGQEAECLKTLVDRWNWSSIQSLGF